MLNLDFSKAKHPQNQPNALDFQLKSLSTFLDAFLNCDKTKYLHGKSLEIKWLDSLEKTPECPEKLFAKAQIKLHWAFLSYTYDDKIQAALKMRQVFTILDENYTKYPNHKPTQLYFGFMNIYLAEIPDSFQWLASLIGLKGNAELGKKLMEASKSNHPILELERQLLTLENKTQFRDNESVAETIIDKILAEEGQYPTTKIIAALYYVKNKSTSKAASIATSIPYHNLAFFHYLNGLIAYQSLDFSAANNYFKLFVKENHSESFKKDVALRLAYIEYLLADSVLASKHLASIRHKGNDALYADKKADKLSREGLPNKNLLRSRIAFDAGNWAEAKTWLLKWHTHSNEQKVEYYYRMGRIEQQLKNIEHSKRCYKSCIGFCPKQHLYYGPFASLFLADIYLKESNKGLASHYIEVSKQFSDFDFKQSFTKKYEELRWRYTH